jgi:hypothetical protein
MNEMCIVFYIKIFVNKSPASLKATASNLAPSESPSAEITADFFVISAYKSNKKYGKKNIF